MKILVVGSGGREHALCWAIAASPMTSKLYCAPGNAGIAEEAQCLPIGADDIEGLVRFAIEEKLDLVVVGPEAPLVQGLADRLREAGIAVFGPSAAAAELEGSKGFTKDLCAKYGIPTAAYGRFDDLEDALDFIADKGAPIVVKADGLAAGKGVTVCMTVEEAEAAVRDALEGGRFGEAGASVVIEEYLEGEELSVFALVDGERSLLLASAQDHKRAYDGDQGPNTGGMGAYSPAPIMDEALKRQVLEEIIHPTVMAMRQEGRPFQGVLFAGLMVQDAKAKLIEYNVRFGDPECQVLMRRLKSDIVPALLAAATGGLANVDLRWFEETAMIVVLAAKGYPGSYEKGSVIRGLDEAAGGEDVVIFHAGTARDEAGELTAVGGRVLGVTALAESVNEAFLRCYEAVDRIDWPEGFCRRDIGWRALEKKH